MTPDDRPRLYLLLVGGFLLALALLAWALTAVAR